VLDGIFLSFWKEKFFLYNFTYFFSEISNREWASSIILDFWKDNFIVNILCFISLLILCLEVEVIKRLLLPLNEPAASF